MAAVFPLITSNLVPVFLVGLGLFLAVLGEWRLFAGLAIVWYLVGGALGLLWSTVVPDVFLLQFMSALACWPIAAFIASQYAHILG